VERSAEPAGVANPTCACEEEYRYGALRERVLDDDAAGCTNEVDVSHHTIGHAADDRSPVVGQRVVLRERRRVPRPARGLATLAPIRGEDRLSNVAFRGITPDPAPAIQAGTGSGVDAGPVGGLAQNKDRPSERRPPVSSNCSAMNQQPGRGW
jgi:hypothetical protein